MELKKRMYTTGVHAMLAPYRMALFHAKGTKIQNHTYCTKDGRTGGPWYVKSSEDDFKRKAGNQESVQISMHLQRWFKKLVVSPVK